jgi:hypothetical protein
MQPNAWKVLRSFFYCAPIRPLPTIRPLADKMKTADLFRASASELDDVELEEIINTSSSKPMTWTLNPSIIKMSRISESSTRQLLINDRRTVENDYEAH